LHKKLILGALVGVLSLVAVPIAIAAFSQTAEVSLTTKKAGKATGVSADLHAEDPEAEGQKPKAASRVVVTLPPGTRYDARGAAQCNGLEDSEVVAGECPAKSVLGTGTAKANAAPLVASTTEDITAYHTKGGVIFRLVDNGADPAPGQSLVIRGKLSKKGVLTTDVPPLAVAGVKVVLTDFELDLKAKQKKITKGKGKKKKKIKVAVLRSPKKCNGTWTTKVNFTYDDGSTSGDIVTTAPCKKTAKKKGGKRK
jgi:hypothetical protein